MFSAIPLGFVGSGKRRVLIATIQTAACTLSWAIRCVTVLDGLLWFSLPRRRCNPLCQLRKDGTLAPATAASSPTGGEGDLPTLGYVSTVPSVSVLTVPTQVTIAGKHPEREDYDELDKNIRRRSSTTGKLLEDDELENENPQGVKAGLKAIVVVIVFLIPFSALLLLYMKGSWRSRDTVINAGPEF